MRVLDSLDAPLGGYPRLVATIGNFDGVHRGHQQLMRDLVERARKISGTAAVITFHPHPLQVLAPNNAPRLIQTLEQKLSVIESLGIDLAIVVPFTHEFAQTSARDFVTRILWERFRICEIYVGPNFAFGHRREGSFNLLKEMGEQLGFFTGKIHQVQFRGSRVSSTAVRQLLMSGHVALARRLLARPFALIGEVAHGTARGAGIGFPTANIRSSSELIPRNGVYVSLIGVDGVRRKSVTNIGVRPTVSGGGSPGAVTMETHILDFQEDLYGKPVTLEFVVRLREERRFPSVDPLVAQIRKDIGRARRFFQRCDDLGLPENASYGSRFEVRGSRL